MRGTYLEAFVSVVRNRNLRLVQLSSLAAWTGEFLFVTVTAVYAFDQDGATGVGVIGFLRVLPATVVLPLVGALADRVSRRRLIVWSAVLRAATAGGAAAAAAGDLTALAYALITLSTVCHAGYRPMLGALLPSLCTAPEELASSNAVRSVLDGLAALVGPVLAAVLIARFEVSVAFVAVAVLATLAGVFAVPLRHEESGDRVAAAGARSVVWKDLAAGIRDLTARPRALLIVGLAGVQCLVRGLLTVLTVTLAVDLVGMGRPGVGLLWGAFGVGGLVAASLAIGAAGSRRLGSLFGVGTAMWGIPLVVCGLATSEYVAVLAFALVGAANALVDISAFTLLQRLAPDHVLARVLALTEAVFALTVSVGSLLAPVLLALAGNAGALVVTGVLAPVAVLLAVRGLRSIDAEIAVRADRIAVLRRVGMLRLLPVPAIERLALALREEQVPAGRDVFHQGDPGEGFYAIESGQVAVVDGAQIVRELGPGDSFGEIALLRSVPRTVTVRATEDARFGVVEGADFVGAVTGFSATSARADALVRGHLDADESRRRSR
jgi:MFS family permease